MSLAGRVALVTGGGRGVGKGISMSLAAAGATVAVNYRRDEEAAAATVAEIIANGGKAQAYAASVDDFEQNAEMVAAIEADHGPLVFWSTMRVSPVVVKVWWIQILQRCVAW